MRPKRATARSDRRRDRLLAAHVDALAEGRARRRLEHAAPALVDGLLHVEAGDLGAFLREADGAGRPDPRCRSRDQRHPLVEPAHDLVLLVGVAA